MYTLQPLLRAGVFEPGPKLTCSVSGVSYSAQLGRNGEIHCLCGCSGTFRSPSAFSVHIKRKVNPGRKADDGWTSTRYMGVPLGAYRAELEQLLANDQAANSNPGAASTENTILLTQVVKQKRKSRAPRITTGAEQQAASDTAEDSDIIHEAPAPAAAQPEQHASKVPKSNNNPNPLLEQQQQKATYAQQWTSSSISSLAGDGLSCIRQCPPLPHQPECDLRYTWVRCTNPHCRKWRQVKYTGHPPAHDWTCSSSDLPEVSTCSLPQQLPDAQVRLILQVEAGKRFAAGSNRPPLHLCSQETFEADLTAFLVSRGDEQLAALVRDKRITCNNSPLDLFGLYRQVVQRRGLIRNERYDDRGRWSGGINFAGDVFPRLMNFTVNNRATSVGNQLLNNYKKFLMSYERAYHSRDVPEDLAVGPAAAAADGGVSGLDADTLLEPDDDSEMQVSGPLSVLADAALAHVDHHHHQQQQDHLGPLHTQRDDLQHNATATPPDSVADVAHPAKRQRISAWLTTGNDCMAAQEVAAASSSPPEDAKQQQCKQELITASSTVGSAESIARLLAAATAATCALAGDYSWCSPGSLILLNHTQEQQEQQQLAVSAAVVAHIHQLPVALATSPAAAGAGHIRQHQTPTSQSSTPADAAHDTHLPVLLLGSKQLCWVERSRCQQFGVPQAHAALQEAWSRAQVSTTHKTTGSNVSSSSRPGIRELQINGMSTDTAHAGCLHIGSSSRDGVEQHQWNMQQLAEIRGLKQSVQWAMSCCSSSSSLHSTTAAASAAADQLFQQPSRWVASAGCAAVADELLLFEAQLPIAGVSSRSSAYWECWREVVQTAITPEQLAHQVLLLAYQCETALLLPNTTDAVWAELHKLLGIAQGLSAGKDCSAEPTTAEGAAEGLPQPHVLLDAPSVLSVSAAVRVLAASLDQDKIKQMWLSHTPSGSQCATVATPAPAAASSKVHVHLQHLPVPATGTHQQGTQSVQHIGMNALMRNNVPCQQKQHNLLLAVQTALAAEGCTVQQLHSRLLGTGDSSAAVAEPAQPCQCSSAAVGFSTLSPAPQQIATEAAAISSGGAQATTAKHTCVRVGSKQHDQVLECCGKLVHCSAATTAGKGLAGAIMHPASKASTAGVDIVGRQSSDSFMSCDDAVLCS